MKSKILDRISQEYPQASPHEILQHLAKQQKVKSPSAKVNKSWKRNINRLHQMTAAVQSSKNSFHQLSDPLALQQHGFLEAIAKEANNKQGKNTSTICMQQFKKNGLSYGSRWGQKPKLLQVLGIDNKQYRAIMWSLLLKTYRIIENCLFSYGINLVSFPGGVNQKLAKLLQRSKQWMDPLVFEGFCSIALDYISKKSNKCPVTQPELIKMYNSIVRAIKEKQDLVHKLMLYQWECIEIGQKRSYPSMSTRKNTKMSASIALTHLINGSNKICLKDFGLLYVKYPAVPLLQTILSKDLNLKIGVQLIRDCIAKIIDNFLKRTLVLIECLGIHADYDLLEKYKLVVTHHQDASELRKMIIESQNTDLLNVHRLSKVIKAYQSFAENCQFEKTINPIKWETKQILSIKRQAYQEVQVSSDDEL